jgi:hypothetical protein
MPVGRCCGCWSPACSRCCARHPPQLGRQRALPLVQGSPLAPAGSPRPSAQCQAGASHDAPLLAIVGCVPTGVLGEGAGALERAEAVLHALVGEPAHAMPGVDRHPAHRINRQPGRAVCPCRTAAYTRTGSPTLRNVRRPRSRSSTPSTSPAAIFVAAVSSASPPAAAADTRAAMLTVVPNQSPSRGQGGEA